MGIGEELVYYLDCLARAYPLLVVVSFVGFGLVFNQIFFVFLGLLLLFEGLLNCLIFKPLAKRLWTQLPILTRVFGQGERPCTSCHCTIQYKRENLSEYGMPSGHAQLAFSVSVFWLLTLASYSRLNIWNTAYLLVLAIGVSWSRVLIRCHSVGQVIVGGVLGSGLGLLNYYLLGSNAFHN